MLGLTHQGLFHNSKLIDAYNPGNGTSGPIMGIPYHDLYARWWLGTSSTTRKTQDDVAILSKLLGHPSGDAPNNISQSIPIIHPIDNQFDIDGVIFASSDVDYYHITWSGGSTLLWSSTRMLNAKAVLLNSHGKVLFKFKPYTVGPATPVFLPKGTYFVRIQSSGGYGNIGGYALHIQHVIPPTTT
ncbi:MAG TPA: hypothetical protein VFE58_07845 [Tepidisphaeraceae bacterium]|jgi:hypothetical protein|nr:hypothetical protein [Tepidisphaeraceae bacterium]